MAICLKDKLWCIPLQIRKILMKTKRNSKASPDNEGFLKFAISLCLTGVVLLTLAGYILRNFSPNQNLSVNTGRVNQGQNGNLIQSRISVSAISGASSDFETNPRFWWITSPQSVLQMQNFSDQRITATLQLQLGRNPCGYQVQAFVSVANKLLRLDEGKWLSESIIVEPNSSVLIPITTEGFGCSVPNDPRIFLSSVKTSIDIVSKNSFDFTSK